MKRFLTLLSGVLSGAVVGAALVLLFTPTSGAELQSEIQNRIQSIKNDVLNAYDERKTQLEAELEQLRQPHITLEE